MDLKAADKISPPNWGAVERKLGGNSYGAMFLLEVDLEINGTVQTTRSAHLARQQPTAIPT